MSSATVSWGVVCRLIVMYRSDPKPCVVCFRFSLSASARTVRLCAAVKVDGNCNVAFSPS